MAPSGLEASSQGIVSAVKALGFLVGTCIGGLVMEKYNSVTMYRGAALMVAGSMFLHGLRRLRTWSVRKPQYNTQLQSEQVSSAIEMGTSQEGHTQVDEKENEDSEEVPLTTTVSGVLNEQIVMGDGQDETLANNVPTFHR